VPVPALIVHGGAGMRAAAPDRPARRRGMIAAAQLGAGILRQGGSALDAVIAAVVALENDSHFNAGYGSMLNAAGRIELDAGLMVSDSPPANLGTGAVAAVSRVRNPILLARAVMEHTRHVLMVGAGAERLARVARLPICRPRDLEPPYAIERWRKLKARARAGHGTVGAAAVDSSGTLAAATSTGGYSGKLAGRVGDSPILGAGFFAAKSGAASATGLGEAIIKLGLCRVAVNGLPRATAAGTAARAISAICEIPNADAGIVVIDRKGRCGYAHNAQAMEVATFDLERGVRYELVRSQR
jgi:L-asparaginase / beta-aspartyl-peptidase